MRAGGLTERIGGRITIVAVIVVAILLTTATVGHLVGARTESSSLSAINGTPRGETIYGTQRADLIHGRGGADKLVARNGADRVFGGGGHDKLRGGKGSDRLIGGPGGATMIGGQGRDQFNMRDGVQVGGRGRDVIHARDGTPDQINCGPGQQDVAFVDGSEEGLYDCERRIAPKGTGE